MHATILAHQNLSVKHLSNGMKKHGVMRRTHEDALMDVMPSTTNARNKSRLACCFQDMTQGDQQCRLHVEIAPTAKKQKHVPEKIGTVSGQSHSKIVIQSNTTSHGPNKALALGVNKQRPCVVCGEHLSHVLRCTWVFFHVGLVNPPNTSVCSGLNGLARGHSGGRVRVRVTGGWGR